MKCCGTPRMGPDTPVAHGSLQLPLPIKAQYSLARQAMQQVADDLSRAASELGETLDLRFSNGGTWNGFTLPPEIHVSMHVDRGLSLDESYVFETTTFLRFDADTFVVDGIRHQYCEEPVPGEPLPTKWHPSAAAQRFWLDLVLEKAGFEPCVPITPARIETQRECLEALTLHPEGRARQWAILAVGRLAELTRIPPSSQR